MTVSWILATRAGCLAFYDVRQLPDAPDTYVPFHSFYLHLRTQR